MTSCLLKSSRRNGKENFDEKRVRAKNIQKVIAASASLKALRDQLLLSYAENLIDADNFMLLFYDANLPKDIYLNTLVLGHLMTNNV